jgi:hypothetical protein
MMVELKSVGTVLDTETKMTYPMLRDGGCLIDDGVSVHLSECESEWFEHLSEEDMELLDKYIK